MRKYKTFYILDLTEMLFRNYLFVRKGYNQGVLTQMKFIII